MAHKPRFDNEPARIIIKSDFGKIGPRKGGVSASLKRQAARSVPPLPKRKPKLAPLPKGTLDKIIKGINRQFR